MHSNNGDRFSGHRSISELNRIRMKIAQDEIELYKRSIVESRTALIVSIIAFVFCGLSALFDID